MTTALGLAAIPVLVLINAFFVAAEFALVAVRRTRVEELVNQNVPRAKALLSAVDRLNDSVGTAQLGITVASLALGLVSEPAVHHLVTPLFEWLPGGSDGPFGRGLSVAITLSVVTFLHVVLGEQMPKIAALQSAELMGLWIAPPLNFCTRLAKPVVHLLNGASNVLLRRLGYDPDDEEGEVHTVDELRLLIEDTEEAGLLGSDEAEVVMNVFALNAKKVRDCMVPWEKVAALDVGASSEMILSLVRQGSHTRLPVYDASPDNIVGVVNTKDLFYLFSLSGVVALVDAVYEPLYLEADSSVSVALTTFKKSHRHMAVVRDSAAGKVVGILTLEDVLEEIVGDIEDEHDKPVPKVRRALLLQRMANKRKK